MQIVVPFGFFGAGNIGDEATLHGFAQLLALSNERSSVSVASRNPAHTARVEPAFRYFHSQHRDPWRWLAKLRASAHAMVGGTPIMDVQGDWPLSELTPLVQSIDRWKVPLAFVGIGTEPLQLDKSRRLVAEEIAPRARHWSVRCDRDRQRLVDYGVVPSTITVAADMAWLIEPVTSEFGRSRLNEWGVDPERPVIGVNFVNENSLFDRNPGMVDALATALDELAGQLDARVLFLANEVRDDSTFDQAAAKMVIGRMKFSNRAVLTPNQYLAPREMMSIISCCSMTMSMRYHFCLFSALQCVPFIAIERSDKIADLCWDMGWSARVSSPLLDSSELVEHGTRLAGDASEADRKLKESAQVMKSRAMLNIAALASLASTGSRLPAVAVRSGN